MHLSAEYYTFCEAALHSPKPPDCCCQLANAGICRLQRRLARDLPYGQALSGRMEVDDVIRIASRRVEARTIVSVAGKLDKSHLAELQLHCYDEPTSIILDLSDLKSADHAAMHWLCERVARGCGILGASPYIELLLEREQQRSDSLKTAGGRGTGEDGE